MIGLRRQNRHHRHSARAVLSLAGDFSSDRAARPTTDSLSKLTIRVARLVMALQSAELGTPTWGSTLFTEFNIRLVLVKIRNWPIDLPDKVADLVPDSTRFNQQYPFQTPRSRGISCPLKDDSILPKCVLMLPGHMRKQGKIKRGQVHAA